MSNKYTYNMTRDAEYAIYILKDVKEVDRSTVLAESYEVYITKRGGKDMKKIIAQQEAYFDKDKLYEDLNEMLKDIEAEYTNKLKAIRKYIGKER